MGLLFYTCTYINYNNKKKTLEPTHQSLYPDIHYNIWITVYKEQAIILHVSLQDNHSGINQKASVTDTFDFPSSLSCFTTFTSYPHN